jgi:hypothetical protein
MSKRKRAERLVGKTIRSKYHGHFFLGLLMLAGCGSGYDFVLQAPPAEVSTVGAAPTDDAAPPDARVGVPTPPDAQTPDAHPPAVDALQPVDAPIPPPDAGVDAPDASPDASPAPDVGTPTADACTPAPTAPFGCGNMAYHYPAQYCAYQSGSGGAPDSVVGLPTPNVCRCAGAYTCECLLASPQRDQLCPPGKQYTGCQVGTTGGVVVGCR